MKLTFIIFVLFLGTISFVQAASFDILNAPAAPASNAELLRTKQELLKTQQKLSRTQQKLLKARCNLSSTQELLDDTKKMLRKATEALFELQREDTNRKIAASQSAEPFEAPSVQK